MQFHNLWQVASLKKRKVLVKAQQLSWCAEMQNVPKKRGKVVPLAKKGKDTILFWVQKEQPIAQQRRRSTNTNKTYSQTTGQ